MKASRELQRALVRFGSQPPPLQDAATPMTKSKQSLKYLWLWLRRTIFRFLSWLSKDMHLEGVAIFNEEIGEILQRPFLPCKYIKFEDSKERGRAHQDIDFYGALHFRRLPHFVCKLQMNMIWKTASLGSNSLHFPSFLYSQTALSKAFLAGINCFQVVLRRDVCWLIEAIYSNHCFR